jgi:hypothetical protein
LGLCKLKCGKKCKRSSEYFYSNFFDHCQKEKSKGFGEKKISKNKKGLLNELERVIMKEKIKNIKNNELTAVSCLAKSAQLFCRFLLSPGEISWHPLTGAIAQLFTLWWFEVCLQVVTCKLHVQLEFSLNSWVIS